MLSLIATFPLRAISRPIEEGILTVNIPSNRSTIYGGLYSEIVPSQAHDFDLCEGW